MRRTMRISEGKYKIDSHTYRRQKAALLSNVSPSRLLSISLLDLIDWNRERAWSRVAIRFRLSAHHLVHSAYLSLE